MPDVPDRIRSLADALRRFDLAHLTGLFAARGDLADPLPQSIGALAALAASRASLERALDILTLPQLTVLQVLARRTSPADADDLAAALGTTRADLDPLIDSLASHALLWSESADGGRTRLHLLRVLREDLPQQTPQLPLRLEADRVQGKPVRERFPGSRTAGAVERALDTIRILGEVTSWAPGSAPHLLRRGGLPQKDLRAYAAAADAAPAAWATVLHTAWLLGLLGHDGTSWTPSPDLVEALDQPEDRLWADLVSTWWRADHAPSLAGSPGTGTQLRAALSADLRAPEAPAVRRDVLAVLDTGLEATRESVVTALAWRHPRIPAARLEQIVDAIRAEAVTWGLVESWSLTALGSALLDGPDAAREALAAHMPAPVEDLLLGADLTVVVPGRPGPALRPLLEWTEVVSRGSGLTLRLTPGSLQRAQDAGHDPNDLRELLLARSRTGLPQALDYLLKERIERGVPAPGSERTAPSSVPFLIRATDEHIVLPATPQDPAAAASRLLAADAEPSGHGTVDRLLSAVADSSPVRLEFVDATGVSTSSWVVLHHVENGLVSGMFSGTGEPFRVPIHRVAFR
jgi:hypothetical protein